jgi:hypothetical protein
MASFRVHYLIEEPVVGPIDTAPLPGALSFIGKKTRLRAACDPRIQLSEYERGTGEPWAVYCDACKATQVYLDNYYDRPGQHSPGDMVADGSRPGGG